jgi:mannitol/fructose-specific phosphotransferase system IIA component (Ntr-type)
MPDNIHLKTAALDVYANSHQQLFSAFARHLSPKYFYDYPTLVDEINHLSANETAAIGGGVMIFHGWLDNWPEHSTSFIRLKKPFESKNTPDRTPVDLALLMLSPKSDGPLHLSRLSTLTRYMRDPDFCDMLRGCNNTDAVESLFDQKIRKPKVAA